MHKLTHDEAAALLADVAEEWKAFWFSRGGIAKNLPELADALGTMEEEHFLHHVNPEKNDFARWVDEVVGDATLAAKLRLLRTQAATHTMITRRVSELRAALAPVVEESPAVVAPAPAPVAETVAPAVTVTAAVTLTAPKKRVAKAKAETKKSSAAKAKKAAPAPKGSVWSRLLRG